jgi:uncharacterized protein (DUF2235 family)
MPDQPPKVESKRREGSANPDSKTDYQFPRRLALCLDGTWNQRDSGTNVYHLSNLILEGKIESAPAAPAEGSPEPPAEKTWVQMVYYDEGVGTGLLDNVTGGALGIGLSENVREAYDWLVERYRDGDEVYIFGFSRGAYTARSLVGLIANCGLLYRGAPMPPAELWKGYQTMAPYPPPLRPDGTRVPVKKWWQPSGAQKPGPFRPLKNLKPDDFPGAERYKYYIPRKEMTETERLLCLWSRRIPIHCLAVFDTVRTLGLEALAIPWIRHRKSEFHKTQLTWLIQYGFHALAIDEHRGNFVNVPWHRKTKLNTKETEEKAKANRQIKQHWFIGAHSNIGGSYDDGTLAQLPLAWFIKECANLGLVFKPRRPTEPDARITKTEDCIPLLPPPKTGPRKPEPGHVRDSYTELGKGIWRHIIRAKRYYRKIDPSASFQEGEEVKALHEQLDPSVLQLIGLNAEAVGAANYNPPNLYEYRKRQGHPVEEPPHKYCETWPAKGMLLLWLIGIFGSGQLITRLAGGWKWPWLDVLFPFVLAGIAWGVDRCESYLTHKRAVNPRDAAAETIDGWLDLLLNLRLIAVGAFVTGIVYLIWRYVPFFGVPLVETLWLLAFCGMMMHFNASKWWAARPMREAGFGSIVQLQNAKKPSAVVALREAWMRLCLRSSDAAKLDENHHRRDPHRLLPVYRTIWRDRVGFIPAYAITFCAGLWMAFSLLRCWPFRDCNGETFLGLLSRCSSCWKPAVLIVIAGVAADYIEDLIHVRYLKKYDERPAAVLVMIAWLMSKLKSAACSLGMAGVATAVLLLGWLQFCHACAYLRKCSACQNLMDNLPPSSSFQVPALVSLLVAVAAGYLVFSTIVAFFKPEPEIHCPSEDRTKSPS